LLPVPLLAMDVSLQLGSPFTWTGEPVVLQVSVTNPERGIGDPDLPAVPGLAVRGPSSPVHQTQNINGQRSSSITFQYLITPLEGKTGKYTIGPIKVPRAGGASAQSNSVDLQVYRKPPPGIRFSAAVTPSGGPVGAVFKVVYTVYYAGDPYGREEGFNPFSGLPQPTPFGLIGLDLPLTKLQGVRVKPVPANPGAEQTAVQLPDRSQVIVQESFAEDDQGYGYKTLLFAFEVVPLTTGSIQLGSGSVALRMKTGRMKVVRDLVFSERVPELADYKAATEEAVYAVRELPEEGRPPGFSGAVGRFQVSVKATPLEVDAFAPVSLEVRVSGDGILEDLKPPAWTDVESITKDFEVSTDTDSGKVEGKEKIFRQVIRPKSEKVTQIPPIPFPYFDPALEKYQVARSEAIPIKVRAVKTAGVEKAIPAARSLPSPSSRPGPSSIVEQQGIGANFEEIGSARPSMDPQEEVLSAAFLAVVIAPPLILLALHAILKALKRDPRLRAKDRALAMASRELSKGGMDADQIAQAYQEYFRARLGLPAGEITPSDLSRELARNRVPQELRASAACLLEQLLAGRFGGGGAGGGNGREKLQGDALSTIKEVHRCVED
jgi:hypothetical protein